MPNELTLGDERMDSNPPSSRGRRSLQIIVGLLSVGCLLMRTAPAQAVEECHPRDPHLLNPDRNHTVAAKGEGWRIIELRRNGDNDCFWARITDGSHSWVAYLDHSTTGGNGWEGWVDPVYYEHSGSTEPLSWTTHTWQRGPGILRACMSGEGRFVCTDWF